MMSLVAVLEREPAIALIWLGVSMLIDGLDGPLARRYRIAQVLPNVDGAVLDHVIDYMTYAVIPALFLYTFDLMPPGWATIGAGVVMVTSLYCFANKKAKTKDNFFSGFPATWNLIVLCFYLLGTPYWLNIAAVVLCGTLTFVPMKFVHPFRVEAFRPFTVALTAAWSTVSLYLVILSSDHPVLSETAPVAYWAFVGLSAYFLAISLWRSWRGRLDAG